MPLPTNGYTVSSLSALLASGADDAWLVEIIDAVGQVHYKMTVGELRALMTEDAVVDTDYGSAQSIVVAVTANNPVVRVVAEGELVGRPAGGNIGPLTAAQVRTILNVENGATADQSAAEVPFTPNGDIASATVQAAITEVRDDTDTKLAGKLDTSHAGSGGAAHADATTLASGFMSAADKTKLDGVEAGATADQSAAEVAFTPNGDIAASDVQAAVQEVRDDADTKLAGKLDTSHEGSGGAVHANAVAGGAAGFLTGADKSKLDGVEAGADVTDATNVDAAGAVMDADFAGTDTGYLLRTGLANYAVLKNNLSATVPPGVTDDSSAGYGEGSSWVDATANEVYFCADPAVGAAVWVQVGSGAGVGDHGALTGLGDDDHTIYLLVDGTRAMAASLNMGGFNITNVGTVDGRDLSVDGTKLDGIETGATADQVATEVPFTPSGDIAAANVQAAIVEVRDDTDTKLTGKLDTSHEGAGGLVHATVVAGGASGFMTGADKTKLDGIETGATADQSAAEVAFTPDGDIAASNVQAAIAEVRDDTDTKLGDKVELGGQIGGSISTPDVRGVRETSGPTLLTLGAIADGEYLVRSGTTVVGSAGGGGGVTDHGALTGLGDVADHPGYLTLDGTRPMTGGLDMGTFAISNVGNVDGRDVSADGTKLDGIESGATADQTAAEVPFTPNGDIAAATVQLAIQEVRDDTDTKLTGKLDTSHEGSGGAVHANVIAAGAAGFMTGADKSKLDGIEAAADVTDAANVEAAGAVMDTDFAGSAVGALIRTGAAAYGVLQHNLSATTDPVATDDSSSGYAVGSLWINVTADTVWKCVDATALAAVWRRLDITAHADLTGLTTGDPHTQYLLADGTRAMAAALDMGGFAVTNVGNVDGRDVSADGTKLDGIEPGATADQTATEVAFTPSGDIIATNVQAAVVEVRDDTDTKLTGKLDTSHEGSGGAVHANVVAAGAAGFMTGADKSKLDGIEAGATADQTAAEVAFTPNGDIAASTVQLAIQEVRDDTDTKLTGKLDTSHAGSGGTAHANAVASGAAGFMTGADKAKLDGIEAGAAADQSAAEVAFTPDGDIAASTVQAAIVEVRNDTDTKLGDKVEIGGQIGGTISTPDVRGIRETSGPTLLTLGSVADGEYLVRSGTTLVGGSPGGGGGGPTVDTADTTSVPQTVTLPTLPSAGTRRIVMDTGGNAETNPVTINTTGADTIEGQDAVYILKDGGSMTFISDGTEWRIESVSTGDPVLNAIEDFSSSNYYAGAAGALSGVTTGFSVEAICQLKGDIFNEFILGTGSGNSGYRLQFSFGTQLRFNVWDAGGNFIDAFYALDMRALGSQPLHIVGTLTDQTTFFSIALFLNGVQLVGADNFSTPNAYDPAGVTDQLGVGYDVDLAGDDGADLAIHGAAYDANAWTAAQVEARYEEIKKAGRLIAGTLDPDNRWDGFDNLDAAATWSDVGSGTAQDLSRTGTPGTSRRIWR